ncbi:MAG: hypothetical protein M3277_08635 [Actinomycetota bacterium]|nr:hypothetical protein [Actinomycetota bacterium]
MSVERDRDPVEDVERDLDKAEDADESGRLETIEKVHDDLAKELEGGGDAPAPGH